jgi:peptide/nickel transport system ATP-binding protein
MPRALAPVVAVRDLTLEFPTYRGAVQALSGVRLEVGAGEIVGLVGESGCGKSVTAMSMLRLLPRKASRITAGSIVLLGRDVVAASERTLEDLRGKAASMVFQEPMTALNPTIRIGRQITGVIRRHEALSESEAAARAETLLTEMQVPDAGRVMRNYPFELSGGMRQRVLIAMAFACNPEVLIADEPTTALDVTVQAQVLALLRERAAARGTAVLFITHDLAVVAQLCSRVYVMYAGRVVEEGTTEAVLRRPLHPYTRALLGSLPEFAAPKLPLAAIGGSVPNLMQPPEGCRFRPRCPLAQRQCHTLPPLAAPDAVGGHRAACWFVERLAHESEPLAARGAVVAAAPASLAPLVVLEGIEVRFPIGADWRGRPRGLVHALNGVDLEIRKGETLGVVGESGCGKSTLAQVIMGLQRPTRGRVVFDGVDLAAGGGAAALRRLRRRFQVVFQDPQASLDPRMRVWRVIAEPLVCAGQPRAGLRAQARALAEQVGLRPEQLDRYPHELSGGQRQRVAIARALSMEPDLLVLDEPTSALDVSVQAQILNLLMALQQQLGLTYLFISHNVSVVRHIADRVAVMYLGQVVELGAADEVLEQPRHPYTRTLLAAVPKLGDGGRADAPTAAELPSKFVLPTGCFFRDRCAFRADGCEHPQALAPYGMDQVSGARALVRCHRASALS